MTTTSFDEQHFTGIQALRGLAALLVVAEHIRFLACGAFGVDIFFCISGFMMMLSTRKSTEHFLGKRLLRVLPFYWLMTIGSFLLMYLFPQMFQASQASLDKLVKSLLCIPFDMGGGVLQPLFRIGWTVNCEILFYLLFLCAMKLSYRYRGLVCSLLLLLPVLLAALLSGGTTITGTSLMDAVLPAFLTDISAQGSVSPWLAPFFFYGHPVMLEFILGILCYYVTRFLYDKISSLKPAQQKFLSAGFLAVGLVLAIVLAINAKSTNILGYRRVLIWGLPAALAVILFALGGLYVKLPRPSTWLGDISFSVYLMHYYPVMLLDRKVFDFGIYTTKSAIGALFAVVLSVLLGAAAWYLIEKRLTKWLHSKLLR